MKISPLQFYKCLADDTRLKSLLLIQREKELCVCELTEALQLSQPKVSRHLAQLRELKLLEGRRESQWIYYRLNPKLPAWVKQVLKSTAKENSDFIQTAYLQLQKMGDRPQRSQRCC